MSEEHIDGVDGKVVLCPAFAARTGEYLMLQSGLQRNHLHEYIEKIGDLFSLDDPVL